MNGLPEPSAVARVYPTLAPRFSLTTAARHDARLCSLGSNSAPLRDIHRTVEMPLAYRTKYGESGPGNAIAHAGDSWFGTLPMVAKYTHSIFRISRQLELCISIAATSLRMVTTMFAARMPVRMIACLSFARLATSSCIPLAHSHTG
jgi:hypothetical protein